MHSGKLLSCALVLGLLVALSGCATAFVNTARAVDVQKATVEDAYRQLVRQHNAKAVPDPIFATGTAAYNVWASAENVAAKVLSSWKAQIDTGTPVDVQGKVNAALKVVLAAGDSFLKFIEGIAGIKKTDASENQPLSSLPFVLATLPLLSLRTRRCLLCGEPEHPMHDVNPARLIAGGAGPSVQEILAAVTAAGGILTTLLSNGEVQAALHVAGTFAGKIKDWIERTGPDFAAMTPAEIEAHFTAKTAEQIQQEEGGAPAA